MNRAARLVACAGLAVAVLGAAPQDDSEGPVIVVETTRGTFTIATYPEEAPLTVAHIVQLAGEGFYDGLRVHRVVAGVLVQFGDPQTRDISLRDVWGLGPAASSGHPIGVGRDHAEASSTGAARSPSRIRAIPRWPTARST